MAVAEARAEAEADATEGETDAERKTRIDVAVTMAEATCLTIGTGKYAEIQMEVENRYTIQGGVAIGNDAVLQAEVVKEGDNLVPYAPDNSIAIGTDATVEAKGEDGIAIGRKASVTGAGGIAIGAEVEAGENATVIDTDAHSVEIGGVDINAVHTTLTDADTALGVRIGANTAGIARNADDIETNRSGIAMSVALAHLPTIKGGGWGIAAGTFDSETAIAVGAHFEVQRNAFIKIGGASSGGETSFGVGFGKGW